MILKSRLLSAPSLSPVKSILSRSFVSYPPANPNELDWANLGFKYVPTKSVVITDFKDGRWDDLKSSGPVIELHVLTNALHYGQAIFEGLKAYRHRNKSVALFNPVRNSERLNASAKRMGMPEVPKELFLSACEKVVKDNIEYLPPFETGGSLYLRPFYFGAGAQLGVYPAKEFKFGVISSPVGLYYPTGLKPVDALCQTKYDRAAPFGVGAVKAAGNYAADLVPASEAVKKGYQVALYLDAKEHKYIEEFSSSNFVAISRDKKTFVTPNSPSILKSITNIMLRELAKDRGLKVEERPVSIEELKAGAFSEVAACGTAVIVTPIKSITFNGEKIKISEKLDVLENLYNDIRALQTGEKKDHHGWNHFVQTTG